MVTSMLVMMVVIMLIFWVIGLHTFHTQKTCPGTILITPYTLGSPFSTERLLRKQLTQNLTMDTLN